AVLLMTVGFVGAGVLLWHPLPLGIPAEGQLLITALGALFYFPGVGLYLWAFKTLGSEFGVSSLAGADLYAGHRFVTHGPFGLMRHPMYTGVLLAAVGALLVFRTWAILIFWPMSWVVVARAAHEEKLLAQAFPDEWAQYAARVPRWIPRWPRRSA
ncbi:MAG: isoprenylcysteine carboxylmethyltransferase family protein, partial [Chloroflexi bacterium]|nr:isoprenylcysteine carboxylmethyltransferase family protein [Chloroflexota bacterium]